VRVVALVLVLVATACGGGDEQTTGARPRSTATIAIVEPAANDAVSGKTFKVEIDLDGGRISKVVSKDLTPDEGHVHVSIDNELRNQTFGLDDKLTTPKKKGRHLLQAEFVAKDHGPFNPRVLSAVPFVVE
jgi:hypothetical protein